MPLVINTSTNSTLGYGELKGPKSKEQSSKLRIGERAEELEQGKRSRMLEQIASNQEAAKSDVLAVDLAKLQLRGAKSSIVSDPGLARNIQAANITSIDPSLLA